MKYILIVVMLCGSALAQLSGVNGDCTIGGQQVLTQGLPSSGTQQIGTSNVLPGAGVQASFPQCSVTVFLAGTVTKASIFSDTVSTPLGNPFTANQDGSWTFFTNQGSCYDIVLGTGNGPSLPYSRTYSDVCLGGAGGGGGGGITGPTSGGGLVQSGTTLGNRTDCGVGGIQIFDGSQWQCGQALPVIIPGASGNGTTDDTAALNAAVTSCPQSGSKIGCVIYLACGTYKTTATWNVGLTKGVHIMGSGTVGTGGACATIQTNGAIWGMTVGNGTSPNSAGFQMDNVGFKDMTGNGLGGVDILATRDALLNNVACFNYSVGACIEPDGGTNFTQFLDLGNIYTWQTKYRIQTNHKTASIYVHGGEGNCQTSSDVIPGSVDIDLGYTNHSAATGTASEWVVTTQTQNCQIGRGLFNAGGNKFVGDKAVEDTINARPNGSFGVVVDGDTASLANGNTFLNEQITKAGTGFYLKPFATNTHIAAPVYNGTNGVDEVDDSAAASTTRRTVIKALTGWTTNLSALNRGTNIVTGTTTANSDNGNLSIVPGTLVTVFNSTGGSTSFNGTFPVVTVSTNDASGITTLTWNQTGANESATINTGACGGAGTCITPLSTVLNAGVGVIQLTGEQITQDETFQQPSVLRTTCLSTTGLWFFDGSFFDVCEANGGILHMSDGPATRFNGSVGQSYTPQPTTTAGNGIAGVPNCSALITPNPQTAVPCPSSDDKGLFVATNTNGTTVCLPPPGVANGYPPRYSWSASFAPGTGPNFLSITPPGQTSLYSISCPGTAATLDGLSTVRNVSIQQGVRLWTDGNNWFTQPGEPSIPLDQLKNALTTANLSFQAGSFTGGGSAGNNGGSITWASGDTNDSTGSGGNFIVRPGHAPASGKNGLTAVLQTFQAGASTTGKEGSIARLCNDFSSDCSAAVHVQSNAVRITISDSGDLAGAIGFVYAGSSIGNPTDIQIAGIYPTAISENSCTPNQFFLISQVSSSTNGRGYCSSSDSPLRIGYTTAATSGTCNTTTPCTVPVLIEPASGSSGGGGAGTVTSVAMTVPAWLSVAGSPIVTAGTLAVTAASGQTSHQVLGTGAGTSFGALALTTLDLPFTYSGNTTVLGTTSGSFTSGHTVVSDASGNLIDSGTTGGSGTVTSFSAGTLSPLFTTSVATATSTPALSFTLSTAAAHKFFGNNTGSTAAPGFQSIGTGDLPFTYSGNTTKLVTTTGSLTNGNCVSIDASGNFVDFGGLCGGGGGGGTVTSVGLAAPTGFGVSGTPVTASGTLTLTMPTSWTTGDLLLGNGANSVSRLAIGGNGTSLQSNGTTASWLTAGTVSSVALTAPAELSVAGSPITASGTLALTWATQAAHKFFGNATGSTATPSFSTIGTGDLPFTYSGNTTKLTTTTGALTNGHCVSIDASGNLVDSGTAGCAGGGFTAGGDLSGTSTVQQVTGILTHALPALSSGFLNWNGASWAFSTPSNTITINNGTGIAGGGTASSFTLSVVAPAVLTTAANSYTAGQKQTFALNGTNAGIRISCATADPSALASGDIWCRSDLPYLSWYDGTATQLLMNQTTRVTLAQLNNGSPALGQMPYVTSGTNLSWLSAGTTGCYMGINSTPAPFWDVNLCSASGNLTYNGTITATSFIGTGPYYLKTSVPGGALSLPGAGLSAFAVDSVGNFYFSIQNAAFGQIPYFPTGAVAADQIAVGLAAGTFTSLTFPACGDTTGNHLNFTHAGGITCGTTAGFPALTTGHLIAGVAGVGADAGNDFTLNTSTHTLAAGSAGILTLAAAPAATGFKVPTTAGASPTADGQVADNSTTHTLAYGCNGSTCTVTQTVATGTATMATSAISSATCATAVSVTGTGILTTDTLTASFNGDPTAVTGYIPSTSGMLTIISYPTADHANFKVCNNTSASITPGAITLNWRVAR